MIFIFPTEAEAELFVKRSPLSKVVISGVGMAACGAAVAREVSTHPDEMIILAGVAGSYDLGRVGLCEVVEVTEESIEELPKRYYIQYRNTPHFTTLKSVTSNCVSSSNHPSTTAHIENMEGAALFATCEAMGVKYAEIRAISNRVGDPFEEWKIEEALESLTQKLLELTPCR